MAANTQPVFPLTPSIGIATLTAPAAVTSRAAIVGTTGLTQLTPVSTNGKRVDQITVKGKATNVASILGIWVYDGTNSYLFDEIDLAATTASTAADSVQTSKTYANLILPATYKLYVSVQVSVDINVVAFGGDY